jgi:hypothetical protein
LVRDGYVYVALVSCDVHNRLLVKV